MGGPLVAASNPGDKGVGLENVPRGSDIFINLIMDLFTFKK